MRVIVFRMHEHVRARARVVCVSVYLYVYMCIIFHTRKELLHFGRSDSSNRKKKERINHIDANHRNRKHFGKIG